MKRSEGWTLLHTLFLTAIMSVVLGVLWIKVLVGSKIGVWFLVVITAVFLLLVISLFQFFFGDLPKWMYRFGRKLYGEEAKPPGRMELLHPLKELDHMMTEMESEDYNPYKIKMLQMQAEFNALQKQISPHFLYNTLETIRSKAMDCGSQDIMELVESLAMLFRFRINRTGEMATFKEELDYVNHYMIIHKYRFGDLYRLITEYDEEDIKDCILPVLTLPPIIENAIFRGLEHKRGGGEVKLKVTATQKRIIISVADNGVGMTPEDLVRLQDSLYHPKPYSLAKDSMNEIPGTLANLNQRIQYYFGQGYGIHVASTQGIGTTVDVMLPRL